MPVELTPSTARLALGAGRTSFAAAWLQPQLAGRLFGLRRAAQTDVALPFLMRLFAIRDGALGLITLLAPAERRKQVLAVGVVVDAADLAAAVLMAKDRRVPRATAVMSALAAGFAVALGVFALRD